MTPKTPWLLKGSSVYDADGKLITAETPFAQERMVACVNALASKNPEALEELVAAVKAHVVCPSADTLVVLAKALASIGGE